MADPAWGALPKTQSDNTTIAEFVAAEIAGHNDDATAHLDTDQSLAAHRSQETLDHPDLSVEAAHVTADIAGVGKKAGTFAFIGDTWAAVTSSPAQSYLTGCYLAFTTPVYFVAGAAGVNAHSSDGLTWVAGSAIGSTAIKHTAFGANVAVLGRDHGSGQVLMYSADGSSWTPVTITGADAVLSLFFEGSDFIALVNFPGGGTPYTDIYTSSDGVNWSVVTQTTHRNYNFLAGEHPEMEYVAYYNGDLYSSLDLVTWVSRYTSGPPRYLTPAVVVGKLAFMDLTYDFYDFNEDEIVIVFQLLSTNGVGWAVAALSIGSTPWNMVFTKDNYLATLNPGGGWLIGVTGNGQTWQQVKYPGSGDPTFMFASDDKVIVGENTGSANSMYYTDTG